MSRWIPESAVSTTARRRTAYLAALAPRIRERAERYLTTEPEGEQVVLACLAEVGEATLDALRGTRAIGTVKQDFGLLVTQTLVDAHGAAHVHTLRREDGRASTSRNPREDLGWVFSFTPHRVLQHAGALQEG